jgi:chromosome segregation ATPase
MREVDSQRLLLDKQRFEIESQIDSVNDVKITNEKAGLALIRDAKKLVDRSHQLDIQSAETENAIALAKVEALNLSSRIAALRESRNLRDSEVADKEKLVSQYEVENRQRADLIDKKQAIVDRLNRKWEKLSQASPGTANMGPLEAEVHNLRKQIDSIREDSEALQRRWLTDQTTLVEATNESEVKLTKISENNAQAVLLNQKAIRLDSAIANQRSELKRLENGVKTMHDDMARINGLIAHNDALGKRLAGSTFTSERAFNAELRELELESASADAKLESLKEEKERLLEDLVESERQVILWEKKITLERETQEALDPSAGEGEVQSMEREVHRMRHRYETLKRDQERLVKEMERAIDKREVIANKHRSARQITMDAAATVAKGMVSGAGSNGGGNGAVSKFTSTTSGNAAELTRIGLQHKSANLRKQIATKLAQVEELDNQIAVVSENARSAASEASEKQAELDALEERARSIQRNIHIASFEKQKAIEHLQSVLRFHQRLQALEAERLPQLSSDESAHAHARLNEAEVARDALRQIITLLAEQHVELAEVLGRVAQLTDAPELI